MQRLSNIILYVLLLVFVVAASLALLLAAWLMANHVFNGLGRPPLPKWLFIGLLVLGIAPL